MNDHDFNPDRYTVVPPNTFEQLARDDDVSRALSRTLTLAHALAFKAISADNRPIHCDAVYDARHGHAAPRVDGLRAEALAVAALDPRGDGTGTVTSAATVHSLRGEIALAGHHAYPLRLSPPTPGNGSRPAGENRIWAR